MKNFTVMDWIAVVLLIIGGLNWGLVGFFNFDFIQAIFTQFPVIARIIFALVGLSALYMIYLVAKCCKSK